jgi:guanosine-3',5'-bis(diphosphate) 3'-pyrophosphohydrolase
MNTILEEIKQFADRAHGDQMRKYEPARYIVHPVRVMELTRKYTNDISVLAAALLHDVLEDTDTSVEKIVEFLRPSLGEEATMRTVQLVKELTDVYIKKNYPHWNRYKRKRKETERLEKASGDAQTVKYADLMDNSIEIVAQDRDFGKRYLDEALKMLNKLKKGNPELRDRAMSLVTECLRELKAHQQGIDHQSSNTSPSRS